MKKRILLVNEFSGLNTGYAVYGRNLFSELHKTGKYELAELACYLDPRDTRASQFPWRVYPAIPHPDNQQETQAYHSDPQNVFGKYAFEKVCLDFKPNIVAVLRDTWMERFIVDSPFKPYFKWGWLATIDGVPQQPNWLSMYGEVDGLFTYTDWSKDIIEEYGVKVQGTASPVADLAFQPVENKEEFKKQFGFEGLKIVGMASRNQARKLYPDLLEVFREVLDKTGRKDLYLYLHCSNHDQGWNLPELIKQNGLSSRVILTYVCKKCGYGFPSVFNDENIRCKRCGQQEAVCSNVQIGLPSQGLAQIYNLWDICIQWASSEGAGMCPVEAAACGVPVIEVDYSAMSDVCRKLNGEVIEPIAYAKEVMTARKMAVPDNKKLIEYLIEFLNLPGMIQRIKGKEARDGFEKHYSSWEKTAQVWMNWIDGLPNENLWGSPPNIKQIPRFEDIPKEISNSEFVKVCMNYVLGERDKLFGFMHLGLLKNLNYGFLPSGNSKQNFGRQEVYNVLANIRLRINGWEQERINRCTKQKT